MSKVFAVALVAVALIIGSAKYRRGRLEFSRSGGYSRITAAQAKALMDRDGVVIVDVRTPAEFAGAHIPGAINIPVETIGTVGPAPLADRDATILLYCRSGARSARAARRLLNLGYSTVHDFGGIISWPDELVR